MMIRFSTLLLLVIYFAAEYLHAGTDKLAAGKPTLRLDREQITWGPDHHLFGYIGQSLTIPWSGDGRYILALQTNFHDRLPSQGDVATVAVIDTHKDHATITLDKTQGWNLQQGTMFYWNPEAPDTQFFFNDRDPETGQVFTVLYDLEQRERVREYRFSDRSIGNSGVSPTGGTFAAINYGRMARLRPVTGYAGVWDPTEGQLRPDDDGIFLVDIATGEESLLVSFEQLGNHLARHPYWEQQGNRWMPVKKKGMALDTSQASLYINHTLFSRDGECIYFFVRGRVGRRSIWLNAPFTVKTDGSGLTLHTTSIGGHPEWAEGDTIFGAKDGRQVLYNVSQQRIVPERTLGNPSIIPDPEGDVSLSPDGQWIVNGYASQDRETIRYVIMRLRDGAWVRSGPFDRGPYTKGNLRTDPAPRWNRDSDAILVPGWDSDRTRQLFVLRLQSN